MDREPFLKLIPLLLIIAAILFFCIRFAVRMGMREAAKYPSLRWLVYFIITIGAFVVTTVAIGMVSLFYLSLMFNMVC